MVFLYFIIIFMGCKCLLLGNYCWSIFVKLNSNFILVIIVLWILGCNILIIIFLLFVLSLVVCIWVMDVDVKGVFWNLLNSFDKWDSFNEVFIIFCVVFEENGGILFWRWVNLLVMVGGSRFWWVESICLNLIKIGFKFCSVNVMCFLGEVCLCWLCI